MGLPKNPELSSSLFEMFAALVHRQCGIYLQPHKRTMLGARLQKRLRACGLSSFEAYFEYLHRESRTELGLFINAVTTNTTDFFREFHHFEFLKEHILPHISKQRDMRTEPLAVWSAACSTGEEPYSLAMVLMNFFQYPESFSLLATDIDTAVLDSARAGVYPENATKGIPAELKNQYTIPGKGYRHIVSEIRRSVRFERLNLMLDTYPVVSFLDIVFCRNALIYFDIPTRQHIIRNFSSHLRSGGFLFIGHSETLNGISDDFNAVAPTVYIKKA